MSAPPTFLSARLTSASAAAEVPASGGVGIAGGGCGAPGEASAALDVGSGSAMWLRSTARGAAEAVGIPVVEPTSPAPAAPRTTKAKAKGPGRAQAAFQRGLAALTQWVEREGADRPVPRGAVVEVAVDGETEPVPVKLGVWISNTKSRKDRLDTDQLTALATLGMDWAGPVADTEPAPAPAPYRTRRWRPRRNRRCASTAKRVRRGAVRERNLHLRPHRAARTALRARGLRGQPLSRGPGSDRTPGRPSSSQVFPQVRCELRACCAHVARWSCTGCCGLNGRPGPGSAPARRNALRVRGCGLQAVQPVVEGAYEAGRFWRQCRVPSSYLGWGMSVRHVRQVPCWVCALQISTGSSGMLVTPVR